MNKNQLQQSIDTWRISTNWVAQNWAATSLRNWRRSADIQLLQPHIWKGPLAFSRPSFRFPSGRNRSHSASDSRPCRHYGQSRILLYSAYRERFRRRGNKSKYKERHYTKINTKYFEPAVQGMYMAVNGGGSAGATARGAEVPGLEVCGKTGTAQNPHGKDNSVFICSLLRIIRRLRWRLMWRMQVSVLPGHCLWLPDAGEIS